MLAAIIIIIRAYKTYYEFTCRFMAKLLQQQAVDDKIVHKKSLRPIIYDP